jgi:hypothetical protein
MRPEMVFLNVLIFAAACALGMMIAIGFQKGIFR